MNRELIEQIARARVDVMKGLDAVHETIGVLFDRYPDDPGLAAPLARGALAMGHKFNAIVHSLNMPGHPFEVPMLDQRRFYFALGKSIKTERKPAPRRFGSVYKLATKQPGDARAMDLFQRAPAIDSAAMSATATICTPAVDRDSEIILPAGIDVESRYRMNPIVLWEHGFDPLLPMPIARCEHSDKSLALVQSSEEMVGTSYFTNRVKESEQVFALIDEGIVRATSVRVDPDPAAMIYKTVDGEQVLVMQRSTLIEWSWGCMGVNPETVRWTLDRNTLAGSTITRSLKSVLKKHAAQTALERKSQ